MEVVAVVVEEAVAEQLHQTEVAEVGAEEEEEPHHLDVGVLVEEQELPVEVAVGQAVAGLQQQQLAAGDGTEEPVSLVEVALGRQVHVMVALEAAVVLEAPRRYYRNDRGSWNVTAAVEAWTFWQVKLPLGDVNGHSP